MGVEGLSVLAHVPTPPIDSSSSHRVGQKKHSLHSPTIPPSEGFGPTHFSRRGTVRLPHVHPLGGILHQLITKGCSLSFSRTGILCWFCSRREQEKSWLSLRIFGCRSHSCSGMCSYGFHTSFGGMCMSPCQFWPCMLSIVVCVYAFLYQC